MNGLMTFLASATTSINSGATAACAGSCNSVSLNTIFANIANALTFIIGGVSVIMIIIGGLRYVLSNGDSKQAAEAKNTILYAVIGVVVSIVAFAIVSFVTQTIGK